MSVKNSCNYCSKLVPPGLNCRTDLLEDTRDLLREASKKIPVFAEGRAKFSGISLKRESKYGPQGDGKYDTITYHFNREREMSTGFKLGDYDLAIPEGIICYNCRNKFIQEFKNLIADFNPKDFIKDIEKKKKELFKKYNNLLSDWSQRKHV